MAIIQFSKDEFEAALPVVKDGHPEAGKKLWIETGLADGEYTYDMPISPTAKIKIRSSVRADGYAAETGKDSIRVWLTNLDDDKPLGNKTQSHITRVTNWETRMVDAIRELWKRHVRAGDCPTCGRALGIWKVKKNGPNTGRLFAKCWKHGHFFWLDEGKPKPKPKKQRPVIAPADETEVRNDLEEHKTIKAKTAFLREAIATRTDYAMFALTFIFDRQTEDEKQAADVRWHNTVGFSGVDGEILTSFAIQYLKKGSLSDKQMAMCHKKLTKYAVQILDIFRGRR